MSFLQFSLQVCVLIFVFLFCWTPYAVLSLAGISGNSDSIPLNFTVLPLQLAKSAVLWNPLIYIVMNPTVEINRLNLLCIKRRCALLEI